MFNPVIIRPEHEGSKIFSKVWEKAFMTDKDLEYFQSLDILDMMEECFNKTLKIAISKGIDESRILFGSRHRFCTLRREKI